MEIFLLQVQDLVLSKSQSNKECNAICAPRLHLPTYVGADLIIQVGSDSILLCSVIYKFVTTNTFSVTVLKH